MEFGSPEKQPDGFYSIHIEVMNTLHIEYISKESGQHTTPSHDLNDLKVYLIPIAQLYEQYSKRWFSKAVFPSLFLSRVQHIWNVNNKPEYTNVVNEKSPIRVCQDWCPEKLVTNSKEYKLHWKLVSVEYKEGKFKPVSGTGPIEVGSEQFPLNTVESVFSLTTTLRSRAVRKVREARLMAAISKSQADRLTLRYYEKYGEFENRDSESVLSSDSE